MSHRDKRLATSKSIAVVIPVHSSDLSTCQIIALQQCVKIFYARDVFIIYPDGLPTANLEQIGKHCRMHAVDSAWLSSLEAYNKFKCSRYFYSLFASYDFLLTYELDSFVFKDELSDWSERNYDYVGAPWFEGWYNCTNHSPMIGTGNSGFSLRRVASCQMVLERLHNVETILKLFGWKAGGLSFISRVLRKLVRIISRKPIMRLLDNTTPTEDLFWCCDVPFVFPWFRIAPPEVAMHFSFEANPEVLFLRCGNQLPCGTHKWLETNFTFWRPHIESCGYIIPDATSPSSAPKHYK